MEALDKAAETVKRGLRLVLDGSVLTREPKRIAELKALLARGRGELRLEVELAGENRAVVIALPGEYDVSPRRAGVLSTLPGVVAVVET
jgi:hypothetical protein